MPKITPFLWFDANAEEAMSFYTSIFKSSKIGAVSRYGDAGPGPKGQLMTGSFELEGQPFMVLNGGPQFKFNEAVSFVVTCDTQEEIDHFWEKLSAGGTTIECGWLKDKFGLAWQIVPSIMGKLLSGPDPERSKRAMQAMLQMKKLDIAALTRAWEGK